jgi:hypothetical protein
LDERNLPVLSIPSDKPARIAVPVSPSLATVIAFMVAHRAAAVNPPIYLKRRTPRIGFVPFLKKLYENGALSGKLRRQLTIDGDGGRVLQLASADWPRLSVSTGVWV